MQNWTTRGIAAVVGLCAGRGCSRGSGLRSLGLGIGLAIGVALAGASGAQAQTNCGALLLPQPNLGQTFPGDVLDPGELVSIDLFLVNTCQTGGVDVPAQIKGTTTITLACTDAEPCPLINQLPGTFGGVVCFPEADVACAVSGDNNTVMLTYTGPGFTKALPAFPAFTKLATITAVAQPGAQPATNPEGRFELDARTSPGDVFTAAAAGSGNGSAPFFFPGACQVQVDRQISCDGGVSFFDVRDVDDPANSGIESCAAGSPDAVVVRHVATNTGVSDLLACELDDGNAGLLGIANPLPIGNLGAFDAAVVVDTGAICSDIAAGEPAAVTLTCTCPALLGDFDVVDTDSSGLTCTPVQVPATSPWGSALLAALLLAALGVAVTWGGRATAGARS